MRKRRGVASLVAITVTGLVAATSAVGFGDFGSPDSIAVTNSYQVAIGDLNGDGRADLAASSDGDPSNGFQVALGKRNGSPQPSGFVSTTTKNPEGIAIGKFDGDRRADVALSDYIDDSITIFSGLKGGGFEAGPPLAAGDSAFLLATGDFNEDGRTDLASCNYTLDGKEISIMLQKRHGGFKAHRDLEAASGPCMGIDVGRINGDKHLDLVEQSSDGPFAILLGRGDGTFRPHKDHVALTSNGGYDNVALGDFTGDGRNDVAVASEELEELLIYPGHKDGSLGAPKLTGLDGLDPEGLAAADYNRDGKLDLAVGGHGFLQLTVLIGKGNGRFKDTPRTAPESDSSLSITSGRLNHDKAPDIVVGTDSTADIYINGNP